MVFPGTQFIDHAFDEAAIQLAQPVPDDLRQALRKRFEKALAGTVSTGASPRRARRVECDKS